jgi:hypothetical protein
MEQEMTSAVWECKLSPGLSRDWDNLESSSLTVSYSMGVELFEACSVFFIREVDAEG